MLSYKRLILTLAVASAGAWIALLVIDDRIAAVAAGVISAALLLAIAVARVDRAVRSRPVVVSTPIPARHDRASREVAAPGGLSHVTAGMIYRMGVRAGEGRHGGS